MSDARAMYRGGVVLMLVLLITLSAGRAWASDITVSAAMSLKESFTELGRQYEAAHPDIKVVFNFGASGDLVRQIAGGAPVDVLASASAKDMSEAEGLGLLVQGSRQSFASNALVAVVASSNPIKVSSFEALATAGAIKHVSIGNPKTTPVGRYTMEVLGHYQIAEKLSDKLVPTENVRQAMDYLIRGEVEAAIVYRTDAMANSALVSVAAEAPVDSHQPVVYPIALIKGGSAEGSGFLHYVMSSEGQAALRKFGFLTGAR